MSQGPVSAISAPPPLGRLRSAQDECLVLIKALPHRSSNYFETVCCAGLGRDGRWRRQYPVPFRILQDKQKFRRWNWIRYEYTSPSADARWESQKVVPESIQVTSTLGPAKRASALNQAFRTSFADAESRGESLLLMRPREVRFLWRKKTASQLDSEYEKHKALASQGSFLDVPASPLTPCPYTFYFLWKDPSGIARRHTCDDWESSTAFMRRRSRCASENEALLSLQQTYEVDYPSKGMAFGMGTHGRRKNQWLLVGVLRVGDCIQSDLFAR